MSPPQEPPSTTIAAAATVQATTTTTKKLVAAATHTTVLTPAAGEAAVASLQEFLRFETVSSLAPETGAYVECATWLQQRLHQASCFDEVLLLDEAPAHSPVVVAVWRGHAELLPCLLLNSHYDVVPASSLENNWTVPPFEGLRRDGKIYGRGAQDMKCVCVQYIVALEQIHQQNPDWRPQRDVYLTFVPDEEVGGSGMAAFLDSALYKNRILPAGGIGLALDEGLASTTADFSLFYGERLPWWVNVTATGPTGHGSRFIEGTAVEQLVQLANKALAFRQGQRDLLGLDDHSNCAHAVAAAAAAKKKTLGDVTSLNITTLQAGVQVGDTFAYNCVPPKAHCSLDIRIAPHTQPSEIGAMLDQWCQECSSNDNNNNNNQDNNTLEWSYIDGHGNDLQQHAVTSTDATQNPWFQVFCDSLHTMGYGVQPAVFPAATDSRFLRALGIRAFGFSPMRHTEIMLHEDDEYIPESTFLEGIVVYIGLLKTLASQGEELEQAITEPIELPN